jgi:hypothetical protein
VFARFNRLFGEMPAPQTPRLVVHFVVTGLTTAAALMSYFWPVGPW